MIRDATNGDLDAILAMAKQFVDTTAYGSWMALSPQVLRAFVERLLALDTARILLAVGTQGPIGMLALWIFPHPMSGHLVAQELVWWVEPTQRGIGVKLLRQAEQWARAHGASEFQMVAPTDRVGQFYERVGYQAVERLYRKPLRGGTTWR